MIAAGVSRNVRADRRLEHGVGRRGPPPPLGAHAQRRGLGDADDVGQLDLAGVGEPRRDDVLRDVARHVGRRAVDLARVLAAERAAAVRRPAAVRVDDDLAPRQSRVALRASDGERARRVDVEARPRVAQSLGHAAGSRRRSTSARMRSTRDRLGVLAGDDDRVEPARAAVVAVLDRHLRLAVGAEIAERARGAQLGQPARRAGARAGSAAASARRCRGRRSRT